MNEFVVGYYAMLIGGSCLAAYWQKQTAFLLLFSLTLVSFMGIIGGEAALWTVTVCAALLALSAGTASHFESYGHCITHGFIEGGEDCTMTAAFGMFVIMTYAIAGIFAPIIAPFSESEVISQSFAPPDENMLLGADQLGRDMFSRIVYGARNTVGLALMATILAFLMGAIAGLLAAKRRASWISGACC